MSEVAWLIKTDADGTKQWDKTFGSLLNFGVLYSVQHVYSVQQTSDGGYILAGNPGTFITK